MKIAYDENLSPRIVRLFEHLPDILTATECEFISIKDKYGEGTRDEDWIEQYAKDGGQCFLSNDFRIKKNKAELNAYLQAKLKGIFMPKEWSGYYINEQVAFIILKWPMIKEKFENMNPSDMARLKPVWQQKGKSWKNKDKYFEDFKF